MLTLLAYCKAWVRPSHRRDCRWSGSFFYDLFMGVELNPRLGSGACAFDLKLFCNGRPGIAAWTLINAAFAAQQYRDHGHVSNSMIVVAALQALYVLDFFWNGQWEQQR